MYCSTAGLILFYILQENTQQLLKSALIHLKENTLLKFCREIYQESDEIHPFIFILKLTLINYAVVSS